MSHGLQALVSYNLAKSSDLGSDDLSGLSSGECKPGGAAPADPLRLRHTEFHRRRRLVRGAGARMGPRRQRNPERLGNRWPGTRKFGAADQYHRIVVSPVFGRYRTQAEIVPGQPFWIPDSTQPAGRALNPAAFTSPPAGQMGDFPRNGLRSPYSIDQTDLAVRRRFNLTDRLKLSVRAEYFNVFNHPMFGAPGASEPGNLFDPSFGKIGPGSTTNLELGSGAALGGQSPLYALGGPAPHSSRSNCSSESRLAKNRDRFPETFPKRESPKNKSRIGGMFFATRKATVRAPPFTSIPPRIHHQKTTFCHPFFPKTPAKTPNPLNTKKIPKYATSRERSYG